MTRKGLIKKQNKTTKPNLVYFSHGELIINQDVCLVILDVKDGYHLSRCDNYQVYIYISEGNDISVWRLCKTREI